MRWPFRNRQAPASARPIHAPPPGGGQVMVRGAQRLPSMPGPPPAPPAARTVQAAELEEMFGDVAEAVARLQGEGIEPRAIAIRPGALDGLSVALGLPVVWLAAGSPVKWGVIV